MASKDLKRRAVAERERDARGDRRAVSDSSDATATSAKGRLPQDLTTSNKIMIAASQIDEERETFTAEDLIVVAWKLFPESFGLSGYRELYPDSNRVLSKLMGSVGLCSRGWLEQVSTKTYKLTPAGRKLIVSLRERPAESASPKHAAPSATRLRDEAPHAEPAIRAVPRAPERPRTESAPRREAPAPARIEPTPAARSAVRAADPPAPIVAAEPMRTKTPEPAAPKVATPVARPVQSASAFDGLPSLQRIAMSVASQKFTRGGVITFVDACAFWSITQGLHPAQLPARMSEIESLLKRAETYVQQTGAPIRVNDRLEVTLTTVIGLQGLHRMLMQKYHRELENIRGRAQESNEDDG